MSTINVITAKKYIVPVFLFCLLLVHIGCKKNNIMPNIKSVSLNVVNAAPGVAIAKVKTPNAFGYYSKLTGVNYGAASVFTLPANNPSVTVRSGTDTLTDLYKSTLESPKGGDGNIYSLYVAGAFGGDVILQKDVLPARLDSVVGVRFINLSYNSSPVNITLSTTPSVNEFSGIAYKSSTDFKTYDTKSTNPSSYTFQVRDAVTNTVLGSTAVPAGANRFHNITLVFKGVIGGTGVNAPGLLLVKNY